MEEPIQPYYNIILKSFLILLNTRSAPYKVKADTDFSGLL